MSDEDTRVYLLLAKIPCICTFIAVGGWHFFLMHSPYWHYLKTTRRILFHAPLFDIVRIEKPVFAQNLTRKKKIWANFMRVFSWLLFDSYVNPVIPQCGQSPAVMDIHALLHLRTSQLWAATMITVVLRIRVSKGLVLINIVHLSMEFRQVKL